MLQNICKFALLSILFTISLNHFLIKGSQYFEPSTFREPLDLPQKLNIQENLNKHIYIVTKEKIINNISS